MFAWLLVIAYAAASYTTITKAVIEVSKRSVKPHELRWLKALIILFSPIAMLVILLGEKE